MQTTDYGIEAATEYGPGAGVNGTGRRVKVSGHYVVHVATGRRCRAFTGAQSETKALEWAAELQRRKDAA